MSDAAETDPGEAEIDEPFVRPSTEREEELTEEDGDALPEETEIDGVTVEEDTASGGPPDPM